MVKPSIPAESGLALLEYPHRYPLKVFGDKSVEFEKTVVELVRAKCAQNENIEVSQRESKGGKYIALTLTFTAHSQQQIEEIYRDLYDCKEVVTSL